MKKPSGLALRIYIVVLAQFLVVAGVLELGRRAMRPAPFAHTQAGYLAQDLARVWGDPVARDTELARAAQTLRWTLELRDPSGHVLAHAAHVGPREGMLPPPHEGPREGMLPPPHEGPREGMPPPPHEGTREGMPPPPHEGPREGRPPSDDSPPTRHPSRLGGPPPPLPDESARSTVRGEIPIRLGDGRAVGTLVYEDHPPGPPPSSPVTPASLVLVLGVVGIFSIFAARALTKPLERLSAMARAFGGGDLQARAAMDRPDEIGDVARAFDDMADRMARLLLAERELLANVSHELRTPLARIHVALDLASEAEPKVAVESFGEIAEDLAELERIVDDVLAAARLAHQGAALPVRRDPIVTRALLEKSVAKFRAAHPDRPLEVELEGDLPDLVGDAVLVRRVVDNLLENAHKYSKAAADAIVVSAARSDERLVIEVRDHGIGIATEDLARIFEPFFRADRSRTRATGGLGLGLSLARRVVDAHGGTIEVTSELGEGTTARVSLPFAS